MIRLFALIFALVSNAAWAEDRPYCDQYFIGEISEETVGLFIEKVVAADCEAGAKLRVFIQSGGGDPQAAMGLFDWLQVRTADTVAMGDVASAAVPLFLAGEKRTALPNTRFLVHPGNMYIEGDFDQRDRDEYEAGSRWDDETYRQTIVDRTGLPRERVNKMVEPFTFFNMTEAREWGFLTE